MIQPGWSTQRNELELFMNLELDSVVGVLNLFSLTLQNMTMQLQTIAGHLKVKHIASLTYLLIETLYIVWLAAKYLYF